MLPQQMPGRSVRKKVCDFVRQVERVNSLECAVAICREDFGLRRPVLNTQHLSRLCLVASNGGGSLLWKFSMQLACCLLSGLGKVAFLDMVSWATHSKLARLCLCSDVPTLPYSCFVFRLDECGRRRDVSLWFHVKQQSWSLRLG